MPWGKYSGMLVGSIIEDDPSYIEWALANSDTFRLDESALAYLRECAA